MANNDDNILYLRIVKHVLYGCELVISYRHQNAYLWYSRSSHKEIPYDLAKEISKDSRIELDSGNFEFNEKSFRRTEDWEKHLNELKLSYPNLFRKEKIRKLLNSK